MRVYSLYLSTTQANGSYTPIDTTNMANVGWLVNWREIFNDIGGECRVRVKLLSSANANYTWANNTGSVHISLLSNCSNTSYGVNVGYIRPYSDFTGANSYYLDCDTLTSNGTTCTIPNNTGVFRIIFLNAAGNLMTIPNGSNYQIWLYFEVDNDNNDDD